MATLRIGRSRRIWAGLLLVVVAGCAGAGGCGGDKPPLSGTPAGDAISRHDLALMMLPPDELGMDSLEIAPASGRESNAHAAERSLDPDDTGRDIRKRGRIDGYFVTYLPAGAPLMSDPDIHIIGAVELFREESQASDWIDAQIGAFEDVASGDLDAELDYDGG